MDELLLNQVLHYKDHGALGC